MLLTRAALSAALARVESLLLESHVVEAVLARREAGCSTAEDAENRVALTEELLSHQHVDGSWSADLGRTAEALLLLGELLPESRLHADADRAIEWLRSRQDQPGCFGAGCDPGRHALGVCAHALAGGFFSPAEPRRDLAGRELTNGLKFLSDSDARLGLSALALRALLRWSEPTEPDRRQLTGLTRLAERSLRPGKATPAGLAAVLQLLAVLAVAPIDQENATALHGALSRFAAGQRADGSWNRADVFHALELLLLVTRHGDAAPIIDAAVQRSAELLTIAQKPNGSWGSATDPYRLLIGWRTLRRAVETMDLP